MKNVKNLMIATLVITGMVDHTVQAYTEYNTGQSSNVITYRNTPGLSQLYLNPTATNTGRTFTANGMPYLVTITTQEQIFGNTQDNAGDNPYSIQFDSQNSKFIFLQTSSASKTYTNNTDYPLTLNITFKDNTITQIPLPSKGNYVAQKAVQSISISNYALPETTTILKPKSGYEFNYTVSLDNNDRSGNGDKYHLGNASYNINFDKGDQLSLTLEEIAAQKIVPEGETLDTKGEYFRNNTPYPIHFQFVLSGHHSDSEGILAPYNVPGGWNTYHATAFVDHVKLYITDGSKDSDGKYLDKKLTKNPVPCVDSYTAKGYVTKIDFNKLS